MARDKFYKGVVLKYEADMTELSAALGKLDGDLKQSRSAAKALDAALKLDPESIGLVRDRAEVAAKQVELMRGRAQALKAALDEVSAPDFESKTMHELADTLDRIRNNADLSADELRKLKKHAEDLKSQLDGKPELVERLTQQSDIAEAKLKSLTEQLVRLNVEAAKQGGGFGGLVSSLQGAGETLSSIGDAAASVGDRMTVGLTAPIVAFGAAAFGAATTVDSALTGVRKTVDATEEEYQALKEAAIEYSKTNGVTAETTLEVQALAAQLGYAKDELEMMGRVGTGLDIATDMGAEQATTELAQFANITGMARDQSENYASTVVALGNTMATTESKVSGMAQSVAAAGTQVGMSQSEILGLAAALASLGLEAQGGGSNISKIMSQIDKDVATSSENVRAWAQAAGMGADEFAAKWRERPVEALQALFAGMSSAVEGGSNLSVILEELGIESSQATDVAKRLANGHELLGKAIETANVAWRENTALSEEVANKNESLDAKVQMLQNRVTAMLEKVGKPVADALLAVVDAAEPLFDALESGAKAFADMDEGQQRLVVSAAAVVAGLGPVLSIGGRIVETFGGVLTSLGNAGEGMLTFARSMRETHDVTASLNTVQAGLADTLATGLAGAGIAAAVVTLGYLASQVAEAAQHESDMAEATDGLVASVAGMDSALQATADGASSVASSVSATAKEIESLSEAALRSQQEMASSITEAMDEAGTSSGMLDVYARQIEELSGKSELTAGEQEKLRAAVDGFNSIAQTSISIIDAQTGALSTSVGAILAAKDAYQEYARAQALMSSYTKVQEQLVENEMEQAKYEEVLKDGIQERSLAQNLANGTTFEQMDAAAAAARGMEEAKEREDALRQSLSALEGMISETASTTDGYQATLERLGLASKTTADDTESTKDAVEGLAQASGDAATAVTKASEETVRAQQQANDQAYRERQQAYQREANELSKALDAQYRERQRAYQQEADQLSKAMDQEYRERQKEYQREADQLSKALDQEYRLRQAEYQREADALSKALDQELQARSKAYDQEYSQLSKQLDREYQQLSKALASEVSQYKDASSRAYQSRKAVLDSQQKALSDALAKEYKSLSTALSKETDARKKTNSRAVEEARKANDAEVKAYQAATKERIASIDEEYRAKLRLLEADPRSSAIDTRIKELETEGKVDDRAAKERERAEKESELRKEVDRAKSRRKRAEAEKALSDYLLKVEEERREESRQDEIAALREEQSLIKDDIDAKKSALKEEYDHRKEVVETERASELETIREANSLEVEALREKLALEEEAQSEANAARLEQVKAANDERLTLMSEANARELEEYKAATDARAEAMSEANAERLAAAKEHNDQVLSNLKESQQAELESLRESNSERVSSLRDAQAEELEVLKERNDAELTSLRDAQSEELRQLKESQSDQLSALREGHQEQLRQLKDSQTDQLTALREAQSEALRQLKDGLKDGTDAIDAAAPDYEQAARDLADKTVAAYEQHMETMPQKANAVGGRTLSELLAAVNDMPWAVGDVGTKAGDSLQEKLGLYVPKTRDKGSEIKAAGKEGIDPMPQEFADVGQRAGEKLEEQLGLYAPKVTEKGKALKDEAKSAIDPMPQEFSDVGDDAGSRLADALASRSGDVNRASSDLARDDIVAPVQGAVDDAPILGQNFDTGVANGIYDGTYVASQAASALADSIIDQVNAKLEINSPSKVGARIGSFFGQGVGVGIHDATALVGDEASRMADEMAAALDGATADPVRDAVGTEGNDARIQALRDEATAAIEAASAERTLFELLAELSDEQASRESDAQEQVLARERAFFDERLTLLREHTDQAAAVGEMSLARMAETFRGERIVDALIRGMESRESELASESERLARIVEGAFSPDLSLRFDSHLGYGRDAYAAARPSAGTTVGRQEISVSIHLDGVSLSGSMDVRDVSRDLARQTAAEIAARLG